MTRQAGIWMPFYWGDYLRDTAHLDTLEHGAYMLLIGHYWINGKGIANVDKRLATITGMTLDAWAEIRPTIEEFFTIEDGLWRHSRIDAEIKAAGIKAQARSQAGKRGAKARWQTHNNRSALETGKSNADANGEGYGKTMPSRATQSQSPSQKEVTTATAVAQNIERRGAGNGSRRGTRLGANWEPDEQDREFAAGCGLDPERTAAKFRDYWVGKAGQAGVKLDWQATWRNKCRYDADQIAERLANRPGDQGSVAVARQLMAEGE